MKKDSFSNPIYIMLKKSLSDLPSPSSISYLWNFGFLLGMVLTMQIFSGLILSMAYTSDINTAFSSVLMIMKDTSLGWVTRILHMNGASMFFILMYLHLARGIYYTSNSNKPYVWMTGLLILTTTMATAFLGYVLPWGQMSFWGATVITGTLSVFPWVGDDLVKWIWGGSSISQPTLNRFFSLHFFLPMLIFLLVFVHIMFLHEKGSSNQFNSITNLDKVKFNPLFLLKDSFFMIVIFLVFLLMIFNFPNSLGDVENFNLANTMVAPIHIQPEWYFLFAYVILRSIPSKLGGVIALSFSIIIFLILVLKKNKSTKFSYSNKFTMWFFISVVMILTWIGGNTVMFPFEKIGQIYSFLYFFIILMF